MKDQPKNRWYDRDPSLLRSIEILESFPPAIQSIVANGVITLAERECSANELITNLRSMGPEKVLPLFKSKNMRRTYDTNASVHKAINYFFILSAGNRRFVAERIHDMLAFVADYLRMCRDSELTPTEENLSELMDGYIRSGGEGAGRLLETLSHKFQADLRGAMTMEVLRESERGFRIQNNRH